MGDIDNTLARSWQWLKTTFTAQRPFDVALLDTFASATIKELDYLNEAHNQRLCKEELVPRLRDKIYVPRVYDEHTTRKVSWTHFRDRGRHVKCKSRCL